MKENYPKNYERETGGAAMEKMLSAYAPPEFMGLIRDSRNQYRGRTVEIPVEEWDKDE